MWLINDNLRYELNILQINNTSIRAKLPGGLPGVFNVIVKKTDVGDSVPATPEAATFTYEVVVTSISPSTGSIAGGTILTVSGRNFATGLSDNQIFIGTSAGSYCEVISATSTQILCRTPALDSLSSQLTQTVSVFSKITVQAVCTGSC